MGARRRRACMIIDATSCDDQRPPEHPARPPCWSTSESSPPDRQSLRRNTCVAVSHMEKPRFPTLGDCRELQPVWRRRRVDHRGRAGSPFWGIVERVAWSRHGSRARPLLRPRPPASVLKLCLHFWRDPRLPQAQDERSNLTDSKRHVSAERQSVAGCANYRQCSPR
jgi:hypothetical protein